MSSYTASSHRHAAKNMSPSMHTSFTDTTAYKASSARFKSSLGKNAIPAKPDSTPHLLTSLFPPGLYPSQYISIPNETGSINEAFNNKVRPIRVMMGSPPTPSLHLEPQITSPSHESDASAVIPTTSTDNLPATQSITVPLPPAALLPATVSIITAIENPTLDVVSKDILGSTTTTVNRCRLATTEFVESLLSSEKGNPIQNQVELPSPFSTLQVATPCKSDITPVLNAPSNLLEEDATTQDLFSAIHVPEAEHVAFGHETINTKPAITEHEHACTKGSSTDSSLNSQILSLERDTISTEPIAEENSQPIGALYTGGDSATPEDFGIITSEGNPLGELIAVDNKFPVKQSGGIAIKSDVFTHTITRPQDGPTAESDTTNTGEIVTPTGKVLIERDTITEISVATDEETPLTTKGSVVCINLGPVEAYETPAKAIDTIDNSSTRNSTRNEYTAVKGEPVTTGTDTFSHLCSLGRLTQTLEPAKDNLPYTADATVLGALCLLENVPHTNSTDILKPHIHLETISPKRASPSEMTLAHQKTKLRPNPIPGAGGIHTENTTIDQCPTEKSQTLSTEATEVTGGCIANTHNPTTPTANAVSTTKGLAKANDFNDWLVKMQLPKLPNTEMSAISGPVAPHNQKPIKPHAKETLTTEGPCTAKKAHMNIITLDCNLATGNSNLKETKAPEYTAQDAPATEHPQAYTPNLTNTLTTINVTKVTIDTSNGRTVSSETSADIVRPPDLTTGSRTPSRSSHSSIEPGPKVRPLATPKDFDAYLRATKAPTAQSITIGSGVFLKVEGTPIELPMKYLECKVANCRYLTRQHDCHGSHHKACAGSAPLAIQICPGFVKFGFCSTSGMRCMDGIHPCTTKSRFNTCSKKNCPYDHNVTIDQYGQVLFVMGEPSIMPHINNFESFSSIDNVYRQFDLDPPGVGTELGPRNNNDWRDYTKVSLLPTMDEIIPGRSTVYMPHKKMMFPLSKVLDVGFRHQREAVLGPVRDSVADVIRRILKGDLFEMNITGVSESTYGVYPYCKVGHASVEGGRDTVATFSISFPSPGEDFLKIEKVLRRGHLLAILIRREGDFSVVWAKATGNWSDRDDLGQRSRTGHVDISLINDEANEQDLRTLLRLQSNQNGFWLLDFGGVLPDAFLGGLSVLQRMPSDALPFAQDLFNYHVGQSMSNIPPYLRHRMVDLSSLGYSDISHNMGILRADTGWFTSMRNQLTQENSQDMRFTDGQIDAIMNTLGSALSCIQGPPGTGKSFIGRAIVKLLALNRRSWSGKKTIPILLTAQTNHALDETIAGYIKCGLKVARLGVSPGNESPDPAHIQYRSHLLPRDQLNIHRQASSYAYTQREDASHALQHLLEEVSKGSLSWFRAGPYLQQNHPKFYEAFVNTSGSGRACDGFNFWSKNEDKDEEGLLLAGLKKTIPKGLKIQSSPLPEEMAINTTASITQDSDRTLKSLTELTDPWALAASERKLLIDHWKSVLDRSLETSILAARAALQQCKDHNEVVSAAETADKMIDFGIDVIACTASRVAKDHQLLKRLGIEVVVVEEAGEVVESIVLPIFLPSVQQVILIGDHRQLKPYCDNRGLIGGNYNHDKSLFERLVTTSTEGETSTIRLARLDCQRRMRPEIADLLRCLGLYKKLEDGGNVKKYPHVPGMGGHNLLWIDHTSPETFGLDRSYSNSYEASMIAGHVAHLIRSGEFGIRDVVIITPYRAQVMAISSALTGQGSVMIPIPATDMDLLSQRNLDYRRPLESVIEETTMVDVKISDAVLVTTIDNYQGQEADVIFYSAVRSNPRGKVGFVDISNRICVTLSRARHGLYIFGNAQTARAGSVWWSKAISHMEKRGFLTEGIPLGSCNRHPSQTRLVKDPSDFKTTSACDMSCTTTLACGHICNRRCHPEKMHSFPHFRCISACERLLKCGHKCGGKCGTPCRDCVECKGSVGEKPEDSYLKTTDPTAEKKRIVYDMCQHDSVKANCFLCVKQDAVCNYERWFLEFSRFYTARARSLGEGKENNTPAREVFLKSLNLSRAGLGDNTYKFGMRMSIFDGFHTAFQVGVKGAEEMEEKFGCPGMVDRIQKVKCLVKKSVEDDYDWLYKELVKLSGSGNSAELFSRALRKALVEVFNNIN